MGGSFVGSLRRIGLLFVVLTASLASAQVGRVRLGQSVVLSGPLADYGQAKRDGALLYIDTVNRRGGIAGRQVELISLDDGYDAKRAVDNTRVLVGTHKVVGLLGYLGTATIDASLPVVEELQVPVVGLTSGSRNLREPVKTYVFPVRASFIHETRQLVSHVSLTGVHRVALIFQDNPMGRLIRDEFLVAAKERGLSDIQQLGVAADGGDAPQAVRKLGRDRQAVMLATVSNAAAQIISAMAAEKIGLPVYGTAALDATHLTRHLGGLAKGLGQSQVVPLPTSRTRRVVVEYQAALAARKPLLALSYFGLEGFIEAKVAVEGLRRVKGPLTPAGLVRGLESFGRLDLGDFDVTYGPGVRQGSTFTEMTVVSSDGRVVK